MLRRFALVVTLLTLAPSVDASEESTPVRRFSLTKEDRRLEKKAVGDLHVGAKVRLLVPSGRDRTRASPASRTTVTDPGSRPSPIGTAMWTRCDPRAIEL